MRDNTRKYNLDITSCMSYGIGATGGTYQCSILEAFSIQCEGLTISYPEINTEQLSLLPNLQYDQRVLDYLEYINIESEILKASLLTGASSFTEICINVCKLNDEFLVYPFLNGVRVVNIGEANGEAQYKAYPFGDDPNTHSWQTTGTFLGLDMNAVYVFEVRDYFSGDTFCVVSRTISLPTLVSSTTNTLQPKLVYLNEISDGSSGDLNYNIGSIGIDPNLAGIEKVLVNYEMGVNTIGDGYSCLELTCKPAGCGSFLPYCCLDNMGASPVTGSFTLCAGDTLCYNSTVLSTNPGSCGFSYLNLDSVNGLGTTVPTIDGGRNNVCITNNVAQDDLTVTISPVLDYLIYSCSTPVSCVEVGNIVFCTNNSVPDIPAGQCVDIDLCALTTKTNTGTAIVELRCKECGAAVATTFVTHSDTNPQPLNTTVTMCEGDELSYRLTTSGVDGGASGCAILGLTNTSGSFGIGTSIIAPSATSISFVVPDIPVVVAVCQQTYVSDPGFECAKGFINVSPALSINQCVNVTYDGELSVSLIDAGVESSSEIWCKRAIDTNYTKIVDESTGLGGDCLYSGNFYLRTGDSVCYRIIGSINQPATARATINIPHAIGENGVAASVCATKSNDVVQVS